MPAEACCFSARRCQSRPRFLEAAGLGSGLEQHLEWVYSEWVREYASWSDRSVDLAKNTGAVTAALLRYMERSVPTYEGLSLSLIPGGSLSDAVRDSGVYQRMTYMEPASAAGGGVCRCSGGCVAFEKVCVPVRVGREGFCAFRKPQEPNARAQRCKEK